MTTLSPDEISIKNLFNRVMPLIAYNMIFFSFTFVDSLMVSGLGETHLGAVGLSGTFLSVATILFSGILSIYVPLTSRLKESELKQGYGFNHFWMTTFLAMFFGFIIVAISFLTETFFNTTNQTKEVTSIAVEYMNYLSWSAIPTLLFGCLVNTANIYNISKIIVYTVIIGTLVNIFGNWLLIFGNLGFPILGVSGSAISTLISKWIMVILIFILLNSELPDYSKLIGRKLNINYHFYVKMIKKGLPKGVVWFNDWATSFILLLMVGWSGSAALASNEASSFLFSLMCMFPQAFCTCISIIISKQIGEEKSKEFIKLHFKKILKIMFSTSFFVSIIILITCNILFDLYHLSNESKELARNILIVKLIFFIFYNLQWSMTSLLDAYLDTKFSSIINIILTYIFIIPLSYGAAKLGFGPVGIWIIDGIGMAIVSLTLFSRVKSKFFLTDAKLDNEPININSSLN